MKDNNQEDRQAMDNDKLDRAIDAALARYSAVDPRVGLEGRILATLRAERSRLPKRAGWRWSLAAALAAVFVVAIALAWITIQPAQIARKHHPSITTPGLQKPGLQKQEAQTRGNGLGNRVRSRVPSPAPSAAGHRAHPQVVIAALPKLEQFPSPQPLSEQEKMLGRYVTNDPDHAALIAQARTEELRQDSAEELGDAFPGNEDSQQRSH